MQKYKVSFEQGYAKIGLTFRGIGNAEAFFERALSAERGEDLRIMLEVVNDDEESEDDK